ncbi:MAG: hypothetical protein WCY19_07385 [Candidatus Gastranaerophilaceae bacterium]
MKPQKVTMTFDRRSFEKYNLGKKIIQSAEKVSKEFFSEIMREGSEIRKVIIKGRGYREGHDYGGVDVIVVRNKVYTLLPGKRAKETADNSYLRQNCNEVIEEAIKDLFKVCKKRLGITTLLGKIK